MIIVIRIQLDLLVRLRNRYVCASGKLPLTCVVVKRSKAFYIESLIEFREANIWKWFGKFDLFCCFNLQAAVENFEPFFACGSPLSANRIRKVFEMFEKNSNCWVRICHLDPSSSIRKISTSLRGLLRILQTKTLQKRPKVLKFQFAHKSPREILCNPPQLSTCGQIRGPLYKVLLSFQSWIS